MFLGYHLIRKHADEIHDVTFKISFDAMLQIAEDVLGIPRVVVEEDLQPPNIHLALLTYMICVQHSLPHLDPSKGVERARHF